MGGRARKLLLPNICNFCTRHTRRQQRRRSVPCQTKVAYSSLTSLQKHRTKSCGTFQTSSKGFDNKTGQISDNSMEAKVRGWRGVTHLRLVVELLFGTQSCFFLFDQLLTWTFLHRVGESSSVVWPMSESLSSFKLSAQHCHKSSLAFAHSSFMHIQLCRYLCRTVSLMLFRFTSRLAGCSSAIGPPHQLSIVRSILVRWGMYEELLLSSQPV